MAGGSFKPTKGSRSFLVVSTTPSFATESDPSPPFLSHFSLIAAPRPTLALALPTLFSRSETGNEPAAETAAYTLYSGEPFFEMSQPSFVALSHVADFWSIETYPSAQSDLTAPTSAWWSTPKALAWA